jgi:hypothetical protein
MIPEAYLLRIYNRTSVIKMIMKAWKKLSKMKKDWLHQKALYKKCYWLFEEERLKLFW